MAIPVFDGVRLRQLRLAKHLTQQDLAAQAELTVGTVSLLESGKVRSPHFRTRRRLAGALGVAEADLEVQQ